MTQEFTSDWFSSNIPIWHQAVVTLKGRTDLQLLEIGSYEGRSAIWLCENLLSQGGHLFCLDTWLGGIEHNAAGMPAVEQRFLQNTTPHVQSGRLTPLKGFSSQILQHDPRVNRPNQFDFIYVDGSHETQDVLMDAVLSFERLKPGGVMIFDDYGHADVKIAVDAFLTCFATGCIVFHKGWQLVMVKHPNLAVKKEEEPVIESKFQQKGSSDRALNSAEITQMHEKYKNKTSGQDDVVKEEAIKVEVKQTSQAASGLDLHQQKRQILDEYYLNHPVSGIRIDSTDDKCCLIDCDSKPQFYCCYLNGHRSAKPCAEHTYLCKNCGSVMCASCVVVKIERWALCIACATEIYNNRGKDDLDVLSVSWNDREKLLQTGWIP